MEINWVLLTYFVVIAFAISGFFRGWWKEGFTTGGLALLVMLLQTPTTAAAIVDTVNSIIIWFWSLGPDWFESFFQNILAIDVPTGQVFQLDPSSPNTWAWVLFLMVIATTLLGRLAGGPSTKATPMGGFLGALVGGLNGFLIVNILREYLDGRALPGQGAVATGSELILGGQSTAVSLPSSGFSIQFINLPPFTLLDSWTPWMFIIIGILVFMSVIRTGYSMQGVKIKHVKPYGYQ